MDQDKILEMIKSDVIPYMTGTIKGIDKDIIIEWYYSGEVVTREIPGSFQALKYQIPIIPSY